MDFIHSTIIYYGADGLQHTDRINAYINPVRFTNYSEINWNGVNHVVAERSGNKLTVVQAGGYTDRRGMFVDLYPAK